MAIVDAGMLLAVCELKAYIYKIGKKMSSIKLIVPNIKMFGNCVKYELK